MRLEETATPFHLLSTEERIIFVNEYRKRREYDLTEVEKFNLAKEAVVKERKEKKVAAPKVPREKMQKLTNEQLTLLKQLGLA